MPNYVISLLGMTVVVVITAFVCGYQMYINEKNNNDEIN